LADRYAVIGHPVAHSKSPQIHAAFARATAQDLSYERLLAPLDAFSATVAAFRAAGGRGANVTLPFKGEAFEICDETSPRAASAGAVNTLRFDNGAIYGDNTDGIGLTRDIISNLAIELRGKRVLVLGAGGAARGVIPSLLDERPALLMVANRTLSRAKDLERKFKGALIACSLPALGGRSFDVVINATSASLAGEVPELPVGLFAPAALAYDMVYGDIETPFMRLARDAGAAYCADGLGMLVEQAAESFFLWRGVRPATGRVLVDVRRDS
jgi:shikimate dehydrogenase